jgi:toxin ParE1/3/4
MHLILSPDAEAELDAIWFYIATESGNSHVADRFMDSLSESFVLLTRHPYLGRTRDHDLRPGVRSFVVGDYLMLHRVSDTDVQIPHIVRGNRDLRSLTNR